MSAADAPSRLDDATLLARIAAGDRSAFTALYDRHAPRMYGLALRMLRLPADAEDVLQQTWLQVWKQATQYEAARGAVAGWLMVRLRSRSLDLLRRQRARKEAPAGEAVEHAPDTGTAAPGEGPAGRVEDSRVGAAVAGLRDHYRRVLELAYFEGRTQLEISGLMQAPLGSVKTWTRRGLQELRQRLEGGQGG
jgi:RNA polymerase sigma-70 factor (ECF subfamily)